jgi:RNA polymerase sigma factor (sigma-70 family)
MAGSHRRRQAFRTAVELPEMPDADTEIGAEASLSAEVVSALVGNHRDFLAFLEKRVGDRALAEDILQEAFARGLHKLGTLKTDESAVAWFYRVLRNAVIDHHRRRTAVDRKLSSFAAELEQHVEPEAGVRGAVCQCVGQLAGTLKPEYADALRRVEVDGVAVKDYASEAGITSNNAAVRVFRAREALRKQVARSCGSCADHGCLDCTCKSSKGQGS